MQAVIVQETPLPGLPSASGLEILGEVAYVIGDDSPYLYQLSAASLVAGPPIALFETTEFGTGRIPKARKLDLECLTAFASGPDEVSLLVLGSGATEFRETGFRVDFPTAPAAPVVTPLALRELYQALRRHLPPGIPLNLEAAAATDEELLLFQRTVGAAAGNLVFRLPLAEVLAFLSQPGQLLPSIRSQFYALPAVGGVPAGFSGATWFQGLLFVTASVEDTADAVLDGAVLGSYVGFLPDMGNELSSQTAVAELIPLVLPDGQPYRGKVESVAVRRSLGPGRYELLLVTDDDAGGSTAVVVELTL